MAKLKKNVTIILGVLTIISFILTMISSIMFNDYALVGVGFTFIFASLFGLSVVDEKYVIVRYIIVPALIMMSLYFIGIRLFPKYNSLIIGLMLGYLLTYIVYGLCYDKDVYHSFNPLLIKTWLASIIIMLISIVYLFIMNSITNSTSFYIGLIFLVLSLIILYLYKKMKVKDTKKFITLLVDINSYIVLVVGTYLIIKYIPYAINNIKELKWFIKDDSVRIGKLFTKFVLLEGLMYLYLYLIQFGYSVEKKKGKK